MVNRLPCPICGKRTVVVSTKKIEKTKEAIVKCTSCNGDSDFILEKGEKKLDAYNKFCDEVATSLR